MQQQQTRKGNRKERRRSCSAAHNEKDAVPLAGIAASPSKLQLALGAEPPPGPIVCMDLPDAAPSDLPKAKEISRRFRSLLKRLPLKFRFCEGKDGVVSLWELECSAQAMMDVDTLEELNGLVHVVTEGQQGMKLLTDKMNECSKNVTSACASGNSLTRRKQFRLR